MARRFLSLGFTALLLLPLAARATDQKVVVRFQAVVGKEQFACGRTYTGIGTTGSKITPHDFRFYIHGVELVDESGKGTPVQLDQDGKWQLDDVALLDFENATGGCVNGTPDTNGRVTGSLQPGHYVGLRFILGVPFNKNHSDLTTMPPPLNLTALAWVWNAGRKFLRLDFASTGRPRGYSLHLGSTACTPNDVRNAPPAQCKAPNRAQIDLPGFDSASDAVIVDLAALLKDSNVDTKQEKGPAGCMSGIEDTDCAPIFANLGLPFGDRPAGKQTLFRLGQAAGAVAHSEIDAH
jgi:uncharacterized repeat protein (TIGR04052 family)